MNSIQSRLRLEHTFTEEGAYVCAYEAIAEQVCCKCGEMIGRNDLFTRSKDKDKISMGITHIFCAKCVPLYTARNGNIIQLKPRTHN